MQIVEKKIGELKPYENNPRKNDGAVEYVANSIREFGWRVPLVIDRGGTIVAGHTRYLAAEMLGIEKIPCVVADDLTEAQIRAYRIADNKVAEQANWDFDLLGDEVQSLLDDFDMTDFGFGEFELTMLSGDYEPEGYDDDLIDEYSENEEDHLKKKRVIIVYTEEQEMMVEKLLGKDSIDKVMYNITEIEV